MFVQSFAPARRLLVFGAIDFAAVVAAFVGCRVTVCDARPAFATKKRLPDPPPRTDHDHHAMRSPKES